VRRDGAAEQRRDDLADVSWQWSVPPHGRLPQLVVVGQLRARDLALSVDGGRLCDQVDARAYERDLAADSQWWCPQVRGDGAVEQWRDDLVDVSWR
jgi:hypothetical protein